MLRLDRDRRLRKSVSVEPGFAMHVLGREQRTGQRSLGPGEYPDILTLCEFEDLADIRTV
jgi:hypothetical protein